MKPQKIVLLLPYFLVACVSGETTVTGNPIALSSYEEKVAEGVTLKQENAMKVASENLPKTGRAIYSGIAGFSTSSINPDTVNESPEMISNLSLGVNFSTQAIDGQFSAFESADLRNISGTLDIVDGSIDGRDFTGTVQGQLTIDSGVKSINGNVLGGFDGLETEFASGEVFGNLSDQTRTLPLYGLFYLKKR